MVARLRFALILSMLGASAAFAQQDPGIPSTPTGKPGSYQRMDYGPVIAHTIHAKWPAKNTTNKGLAIRLTDPLTMKIAVIVYDTDLMRVAAASVASEGDAFIDLSKTNHMSYKGGDNAHLEGTQVFGTSNIPGWANPADGSLKDPRPYPNGPLPKSWTHFKGFYKHGEQVVLKYTVGDCEVLELPGVESHEGETFITRTIEVGPSKRDLVLVVCELASPPKSLPIDFDEGTASTQVDGLHISLAAEKDTASIAHKDRWIACAIASSDAKRVVKVSIGRGKTAPTAKPLTDFSKLTAGGPARWKETIETKGTRSSGNGAYVVDTLTVPEKNPWNSWMRLVGLDFFPDGKRAAVSTWNGDVWIVSGIDDKLERLTWKRFASGLYEPLGLVVKDEQVYALGYDRITRLIDLNGDGEADFYENFHSDWITHPRAYPLCLSIDSKGNFYTIANGNRAEKVPMHGCIHRVAADGSKLEVFATGLRSANGLGIGPGDQVAVADQEGNWTPASRIDLVRQGDFVGYQPHRDPATPQAAVTDRSYKPPLCWLPKNIDNSAGDLVWAPDDAKSRWGPLKGQLLATSYGMCRLFVVPYETVSGVEQGGVVAFPLNFSSGIMRARFNPSDGQLYLAGLKGWQTRAAFDAGFYRVRYTGAKVHMPVAIRATKAGVELTFTEPLDAETAADASSYEVQRWNYVYSEKYGSPEMSVADPTKQGRDAVKVKRAALSKDGKTISLEIEDMKPVMQMMVKMNIESAEGDPVKLEVYHTVHTLGK